MLKILKPVFNLQQNAVPRLKNKRKSKFPVLIV